MIYGRATSSGWLSWLRAHLMCGIACDTIHEMRVVLDTCVLVAAFRSRRGASYEVLWRTGTGAFETVVSVAAVLEYEEVLLRELAQLGLTERDVSDVIDYPCLVSRHQQIFFLWRPQLPDPDDDALLELAANGQCDWIVTHNVRDFVGSERFGVRAITPGRFLRMLGERP